MRGAERPAKVQWTRPFLLPLQPLKQDAARQTFIDIADDRHDLDEINEVLCLTDNMPLAITLLAHLADSEGCPNVLSRWKEKKTSAASEGYDRRDNLDLSISLSLSSPRIASEPQSQELLSLLSILPDGLSDLELIQSKLSIKEIHRCKAALIRTTLAYVNEHSRLKVLMPIREYMQKTQPPGDDLVRPLLVHFQQLLELYITNQSGRTVAQISSNYSNIQNVLRNSLQKEHPDLKNSIYCACNLQTFSRRTGHKIFFLLDHIHNILPQPSDHQLEVYFITELFGAWRENPISNPETLTARALEHFEHFDDLDLKCKRSNFSVIVVELISTPQPNSTID
jgi:hypothetical protein